MDQEETFRLFAIYETVAATYGPFSFLDEEDISDTPPNLIWTSAEVDDGGHLINGLLRGSAVDWHLVASVACDLEPMAIDIHEVYVFSCSECEDSSACGFCDEDLMVEIDFERYAAATSSPERNVETLWAFRKPLGFDYSY